MPQLDRRPAAPNPDDPGRVDYGTTIIRYSGCQQCGGRLIFRTFRDPLKLIVGIDALCIGCGHRLIIAMSKPEL